MRGTNTYEINILFFFISLWNISVWVCCSCGTSSFCLFFSINVACFANNWGNNKIQSEFHGDKIYKIEMA